MDYTALKAEIKDIADIAATVPEEFRQKCFELLLSRLLDAAASAAPIASAPVATDTERVAKSPTRTPEVATQPTSTSLPMKAQLRVFMQRTGVTADELQKVVLYEDGDVHFIREPAHGTVAKGQMEWALLLALKHAILNNEFSTDPEDVRSICQEKGFYDKGNFASNFKKATNASYFREALEPQGPRQTLSAEGQTALGQLVKRLAGSSPE